MGDIVFVEWLDSATTHGWLATDDVHKVTGIATCRTAGFLVRKTETEIVVALNSGLPGESCPFGDVIAIPLCSVVRFSSIATEDRLQRPNAEVTGGPLAARPVD